MRRWVQWGLAGALALGVCPAWAADVGPLLQWTDHASDETSFEVERALYGGAYAQIATTASNVTTVRDTTTTHGERYCWRVRAVNAAGASNYTDAVCARAIIPTDTGVHP